MYNGFGCTLYMGSGKRISLQMIAHPGQVWSGLSGLERLADTSLLQFDHVLRPKLGAVARSLGGIGAFQ